MGQNKKIAKKYLKFKICDLKTFRKQDFIKKITWGKGKGAQRPKLGKKCPRLSRNFQIC